MQCKRFLTRIGNQAGKQRIGAYTESIGIDPELMLIYYIDGTAAKSINS
jgi:hypothetical protein